MKIAVLLTCHNRRQKTETCLKSLVKALKCYNENKEDKVNIEIYLTDDGCTDGTEEVAIRAVSSIAPIHIVKGDGNLFWAGGMRFCWNEAKKRHSEWDYYLLLNDDVEMLDNLFDELLTTESWAKNNYKKEGLCSGQTCTLEDPTKRSFGGRVWVSRFWATHKPLVPNGKPQICDLTNANILLVPHVVVDKIGIFYKGYHHGHADYDYGIKAGAAGFPIIVTAKFCGRCDNEHVDKDEHRRLHERIERMSLKERKKYFSNPLRSSRDYLVYIRRTSPLRYPLVWLGRQMNLYFPKLYYRIHDKRNNTI